MRETHTFYIRIIKSMKEIRTHDPTSHSRCLPVFPYPSHSFRTKFPPRHHFLVLTIENARGARGAPLRMCQGENVWDLVLFPLLCWSSLSFLIIFTSNVFKNTIIITPHTHEECDLFVPRMIKQSKSKLVKLSAHLEFILFRVDLLK